MGRDLNCSLQIIIQFDCCESRSWLSQRLSWPHQEHCVILSTEKLTPVRGLSHWSACLHDHERTLGCVINRWKLTPALGCCHWSDIGRALMGVASAYKEVALFQSRHLLMASAINPMSDEHYWASLLFTTVALISSTVWEFPHPTDSILDFQCWFLLAAFANDQKSFTSIRKFFIIEMLCWLGTERGHFIILLIIVQVTNCCSSSGLLRNSKRNALSYDL